LKQAGKVRQMLPPEARRGLAVELERLEGQLGRVVGQTERRVLDDESVKAAEKLVSLFEEHTSITSVGARRARRPRVWAQGVAGGDRRRHHKRL
jgi:hypothetical protein